MLQSEIEQKLSTIERKLDRLLNDRPKAKRTYVTASVITSLTGWSNKFMEKARKQGFIKFEEDGGRYRYDLNSVPSQFLKDKTAQQ